MSHDRFEHLDGAYVLGALDADDAQAYEMHLRGCLDCRRAVHKARSVLPFSRSRVICVRVIVR